MVYLTDLFSFYMGHGSKHPLTVYAHLMFAFYGVAFNDIFVSQWTFTARIYSNLSIAFFLYTDWGIKDVFDMHTLCYLGAKSGYIAYLISHRLVMNKASI